MRTWMAHCAALLVLVMLPPAALGDAATHLLMLNARDMRSDCAHGSCSPACLIKGTLASVRDPSAPMQIAFRYNRPTNADNRWAFFTLNFPALGPKASDSSAEDDVAGLPCKQIIVDQVKITCPESKERCPGFYYVQVPETVAPKISKQRVEGK